MARKRRSCGAARAAAAEVPALTAAAPFHKHFVYTMSLQEFVDAAGVHQAFSYLHLAEGDVAGLLF